MLSYVYFGTNDLDRAIAFNGATLAQLGMERCVSGDNRQPASVGNGSMVALSARSWKAVDDFYAAYVRDPDGNKLAAVCRGFTRPQ